MSFVPFVVPLYRGKHHILTGYGQTGRYYSIISLLSLRNLISMCLFSLLISSQ